MKKISGGFPALPFHSELSRLFRPALHRLFFYKTALDWLYGAGFFFRKITAGFQPY